MNQLNKALQTKNLILPNRLVMPPMATSKSSADGRVTKALCDYYDEKSRGSYIGLIITEHSYISLDGKASHGQLSISNDSDIASLKTLVDTIHHNKTKVFAQLNHAGSVAKLEQEDLTLISASTTPSPRAAADSPAPKAMTHDDIQLLIENFTSAAIRAKEAGFDGVEIHSAHGYLLNQFYSPLTNKRTDEYNGSSLPGRIRLHLEILNSIRNAVGEHYPIALRLGACDYCEGGSTLEDSVAAAKLFEQAGLDLLDISGGFCGFIRPNVTEQGYFSELTEAIKQNTSLPVILTGGIKDASIANTLLSDHKADLIGVGRSILKDSNWAKQAITSN